MGIIDFVKNIGILLQARKDKPAMEKEKTCCFTGHRKLTLQQTCHAYEKTLEAIKTLAKQGYTCFCCGGALGYDTIAAQAVLEVREQLNVKLVLILPCIKQDAAWADADKRVYADIKCQADEVIYTSSEYTRGCMHKRNRALVDASSVCVCFSSSDSGGTAYTVKYAQKMGVEVINIAS